MKDSHRLTLVSMSGLRVGHERLLEQGLRLPGLSKRANALSQLPPLGLLTIAGVVDDRWQITLVSDDGLVDWQETVERVTATCPDLVAFSSLTPAIDRTIRISNALRTDGTVTIIGGLHATALPQYCTDHFDSVVCGDGEPVFPTVLEDLLQNSLRPVYRSNGNFSLDQAPNPRWDLLGTAAPPRYTLQTLRGCPWACSFCAASRLLGPARAKENQRILEELLEITRRKQRPWIELADDNTFALDRNWLPVFDAFRKSGARWFTESDWRIANQPELLKGIARSGCQQILIGVESGVFRYPGMGGKTATLQRITEACQAIQEAGIVVNACFIVGAEGETEKSIERLGEFLQEAPFGEIQITLQTPFPGTSLYSSLQREGRLLCKDFSRYTLFDVVYKPDRMAVEDLEIQFEQLVLSTFAPAQELRRSQIRKRIRKQQHAFKTAIQQ